MRFYRRFFLLGYVLLLFCNSAFSQSPAEVQAAFPQQQAVFLNYNQTMELMLRDGQVSAETEYMRELMVLSERNASMFSRYKVFHSGYSELKNMEAYTMVPDGDRYKKVKIGDTKTTDSHSNNVFYDDVQETSFDFPALTKGAIEHITYTLLHKDGHLITGFNIPVQVPVMSGTFTVVVPNNISVRYVVKNDPTGLFKFSEEKKKKETIYKWTVTNYKGNEVPGNAPDEDYFDPHIIIYVTHYEDDQGRHEYLNTLQNLFNWNYSFLKDLNQVPDEGLKKIVDSLVKGKKNETEKARSIYKWVHEHIRYVAFENGLEGFRPRQAAEVCNKRYGDCKDMSSIITQMLRMAGIKAYYTWIGTRNIPYKYSELPLPVVDNHMISVANINNQWIFLDGTDPFARYETPPAGIQGKEALVAISANEYKVLTVPVTDASQNRIVDSTFIRFTNEGISGREKVDYYGYFGEDIYNTLLYKDEKETRDYVKTRMGKASNKFILGDYTINKTDPDQNQINITAAFDIPGYGKKVGNEYYINLNLEKLFENRNVDTSKRKVPIEQEYKFIIQEYHILDIPQGYTVTYQPADFSFENNLVRLKISYELKNGKLIALQECENKTLMIDPKDFAELNKAAKAAATQYMEQIVLEKK